MRKAFSLVEILLVCVIIGLLAAVFVPATVKIRQSVRLDYIERNLDKIITAGKQYNSERGTTVINYKSLVDEKYLPKVEPVSGESYEKVSIDSTGGTAQVTTSLGEKVEKAY